MHQRTVGVLVKDDLERGSTVYMRLCEEDQQQFLRDGHHYLLLNRKRTACVISGVHSNELTEPHIK